MIVCVIPATVSQRKLQNSQGQTRVMDPEHVTFACKWRMSQQVQVEESIWVIRGLKGITVIL